MSRLMLITALLAGCAADPITDTADTAAPLSEARLDFARALMKARTAGLSCEQDAYRDEIIAHLSAAVVNDPGVVDILRADPLFLPLHDDLDFRFLADAGPAVDPFDLQEQLIGVTMYAPTSGVFGSLQHLTFESGGVARLMTLDTDTLRWSEQTADWWIAGQDVMLALPDETARLQVSEDAMLSDGAQQWLPGIVECDV